MRLNKIILAKYLAHRKYPLSISCYKATAGSPQPKIDCLVRKVFILLKGC